MPLHAEWNMQPLEGSLTASYKVGLFLSIQSIIMLIGIYSKESENIFTQKILYTAIYSSFVHNCQNL